MENVNFEIYNREVSTRVKPSLLLKSNQLYLKAYFDVTNRPHKTDLPTDLYKISRKVEETMQSSFSRDVFGYETDCGIPQQVDVTANRYFGNISVPVDLGGVDATIFLTMKHFPSRSNGHKYLSDARLCLDAFLPADEYTQGTKKLLTGLWPSIIGIEFAEPNRPLDANPLDFELGSIALTQKGKVIASGWPCFNKLGLNLPRKDIDYVLGVN